VFGTKETILGNWYIQKKNNRWLSDSSKALWWP
jgi:hypothetical protein